MTLPASQASRDTLPGEIMRQMDGSGLPDPDSEDFPGSIPGLSGSMLSAPWVLQLMGLPSDWCELPASVIEQLHAGRTHKH